MILSIPVKALPCLLINIVIRNINNKWIVSLLVLIVLAFALFHYDIYVSVYVSIVGSLIENPL